RIGLVDPSGTERTHPVLLGTAVGYQLGENRCCVGVWLARQRRRRHCYSLPELLGITDSQAARDAVREARRTRAALAGVDIDGLVAQANDEGMDLGLAGLRQANELLTRSI
ncbi:MAG: hypothetical protein ACRDQU_09150, partial [Pseudonocardiaceae bacterium]